MAATPNVITGGAASKAPINLLRYIEKDKKYEEFNDLYVLDRFLAAPGYTVLRPTDKVLDELIKEMKAMKSGEGSEAWLTQQEKGFRHVLKGVVSEERIREKHIYINANSKEGYYVYFDAKSKAITLRLKEATSPKDESEGLKGERETVALNGSVMYNLKGELPKGFPPLRIEGREPVRPPMKEGESYTGGSDPKCIPCSLGGGVLQETMHGSRHTLLKAFIDGYDTVPPLKHDAYVFFPRAIARCIMTEECSKQSAGTIEAVKTLLTGMPFVDTLLLMEPVNVGLRTDLADVIASRPHLIPQAVFEVITHYGDHGYDTMREQIKAFEPTWNRILAQGATAGIVRARVESAKRLEEKIQRLAEADNKAGVVEEIKREVYGLYEQIGKNRMPGVSEPIFTPAAFETLQQVYGGQLPYRLMELHLIMAIAHQMGADKANNLEKMYEIVQLSFPGLNPMAELELFFKGDPESIARILAKAAIGGFFPFIRASSEALGYTATEVVGGQVEISPYLANSDLAYRHEYTTGGGFFNFGAYGEDEDDEEEMNARKPIHRKKKRAVEATSSTSSATPSTSSATPTPVASVPSPVAGFGSFSIASIFQGGAPIATPVAATPVAATPVAATMEAKKKKKGAKRTQRRKETLDDLL